MQNRLGQTMSVPFDWRVFRVAVLALSLLTAASTSREAAAQEGQVTGRITSFAFISPTSEATTTSTALVPMPHTAVSFKSNKPGAALIQFCGKVSPADIVLVEARADGLPVPPYEIVLDAEAATEIPVFEMHCFNWVAPDLRRGGHDVEMMFRSLGGDEIAIQERSLTVLFR
jgi:hypothetical protein